jgi:catalase
MFWDFLSLTPESIHQLTILFSDRGIPRTYRHMDGFSSHTFKWVNAQGNCRHLFFDVLIPFVGKAFWVKIHFKTESGIQNLTAEEAEKIKVISILIIQLHYRFHFENSII